MSSGKVPLPVYGPMELAVDFFSSGGGHVRSEDGDLDQEMAPGESLVVVIRPEKAEDDSASQVPDDQSIYTYVFPRFRGGAAAAAVQADDGAASWEFGADDLDGIPSDPEFRDKDDSSTS